MSTPLRVGVIGLGNIGAAVAANLQSAQFPLSVYDVDEAKARSLLATGASWAPSSAELAASSNVVFTSLPGPAEVRAVITGSDGVLSGVTPGTIWVELSTTDRSELFALAGLLRDRGCETLDSPLTGGVVKVRDAEATLFVSGDRATYLRCRPALEAIAVKIFYFGSLGSAMACKLITNLLVFAHEAVLGEALMLGKLASLDLLLLADAINASFGASVVSERHIQDIFDGSYDSKFSLDLALKDLRLICQLAAETGAPLYVTPLVQERFEKAARTYGGREGDLINVRLLEDETGVPLRTPDEPARARG
jgi:3-hydroxyisobutyrate dehydrogenase